MEWMILPLKRYAEFGGRSRRKEYWMFVLLWVIAATALLFVGGMLSAFGEGGLGIGSFALIAALNRAYRP